MGERVFDRLEAMPKSTRECEHDRCQQRAEPGLRFCRRHCDDRAEGVRFELAMLPTLRCPDCGNLMPEGSSRTTMLDPRSNRRKRSSSRGVSSANAMQTHRP